MEGGVYPEALEEFRIESQVVQRACLREQL